MLEEIKNETIKSVAAEVVGHIEWSNDVEGFCECPGKAHHTKADGSKDCMIHLDGVPNLHCVHSSCKESVVLKSRELRLRLEAGVKSDSGPGRPTKEQA